MRHFLKIWLLAITALLSLSGCYRFGRQIHTKDGYSKVPQQQGKLAVDLLVEKVGQNTFQIYWEDTLDQSEYELNVFPLGPNYERACAGNSENVNSIIVQSDKAEIELIIRSAPKVPLPQTEHSDNKLVAIDIQKVGNAYRHRTINQIEYEPIVLKLEDGLKASYELESSRDVFLIHHAPMNEGPFMPRLGPSDDLRIFRNDNYYIDVNTGKIRTGKAWLHLLGLKKFMGRSLRVVHPYHQYLAKDGKKVLGKTLIEDKFADMTQFNYSLFNITAYEFPY
ncbi:hypothetical protein [Halocola ammonii]